MIENEVVKGIFDICKKSKTTNPYDIFLDVAKSEFARIHGPEHHIIDGACLLTAYYNAGGEINLDEALDKMATEGQKMPGAICGNWGVCGSALSVGCALAIIDKTGPLCEDGTWGKHMEYTSKMVEKLGQINGPRCCKRSAFIALDYAIKYINRNKDVHLGSTEMKCEFSERNKQCIKERCPFYNR